MGRQLPVAESHGLHWELVNDVDKLRALIDRAGLSQRGAAQRLGVDERAMRRYCTGRLSVPPYVLLALASLPSAEQPAPR